MQNESNRKQDFSIVTERMALVEEQVAKLKADNSHLIRQNLDLQSKFDALTVAKTSVENNLEQIKGYYEAEVTNLKIQIKNNGTKMSKSRFVSTSNLNVQPISAQEPTKTNTLQTQGASLSSIRKEGSMKGEGSVTSQKRESFANKNWDEIKSRIHEKDDSRSLKRMNSQLSNHSASSRPKLKPSVASNQSSSDSNVENEIPSRSSSDKPGAKKNKLKIHPKPIRHKSMAPSSSNTPLGNEPSPPKNSPLKPDPTKFIQATPANSISVQQNQASTTPKAIKSPVDYKEKFELAQSRLEALRLDMQLLEDKLSKKDEYIRGLKKDYNALKTEMATKKQDRDSARTELIVKEKSLISALVTIEELKSGKTGNEAELINLKDIIQKKEQKITDLEEQVTVNYKHNY